MSDEPNRQDLDGSGGGEDDFFSQTTQEGQEPEGGQPTEGQQPAAEPAQTPDGQQQAPPNQMHLSEESINQLANKLQPQQQAQPQQQQPLTQEEFDKTFNIVRPTKDQWEALRGEDEAAALSALTNMLHGTSKQAVTLAQYALQQEVQKLTQQFAPALQYAQAQEMERMKGEFFEQYPDLKGYEPLLTEIRDRLVAQGTQFPDKATAFKTVAEEAKKVLAKLPGAQAAGQPGAQPQQRAGTMPALSGKGNVGAGDRPPSGSNSKEARVKSLFGD